LALLNGGFASHHPQAKSESGKKWNNPGLTEHLAYCRAVLFKREVLFSLHVLLRSSIFVPSKIRFQVRFNMDPLSISASAAGLLSLLIQLSGGAITYYQRYKDQDQEVAIMLSSAQGLSTTLTQL
jgi:hypothetical protein